MSMINRQFQSAKAQYLTMIESSDTFSNEASKVLLRANKSFSLNDFAEARKLSMKSIEIRRDAEVFFDIAVDDIIQTSSK